MGVTADHAAALSAQQRKVALSGEVATPSFSPAEDARPRLRPRLLVVDLDRPPVLVASGEVVEHLRAGGAAGPRADAREAELLRSLEGRGVALALVTAAGETEARQEAAAWGIRPAILSDVSGAASAAGLLDGRGSGAADFVDPLSLAARRVERLAWLCGKRQEGFHEVCVIASQPCDRELLMEAGWALALKDAGAASCWAADEVFAARAEGGLAAALDRVLELAP